MINRERDGLHTPDYGWPSASIPCDIEDYFWRKVDRRQDVKIRQIGGKQYHNAGWYYIEVTCEASSYAKAREILEEIYHDVMWKRYVKGDS